METASWVSNPGETNGPLMSITSWSICGFSAIFLCLRLGIRQHKGKIWLDDWAIGISWVSSEVHATKAQKLTLYRS